MHLLMLLLLEQLQPLHQQMLPRRGPPGGPAGWVTSKPLWEGILLLKQQEYEQIHMKSLSLLAQT